MDQLIRELKKTRVRYSKKYSVIEWKRFEWFKQELLCRKYNIILTGHINRKRIGPMAPTPIKEKLVGFVKNLPSKINKENLDKSIKMIDKGSDALSKGMDDFSRSMNELNKGLGGNKDLSGLTGGMNSKKKDYSALIGRSKKTIKIR
jgi:hypothetical protein